MVKMATESELKRKLLEDIISAQFLGKVFDEKQQINFQIYDL